MARGWSTSDIEDIGVQASSTAENTYFSLDLQIPKSFRDQHKTDSADNSCKF